MAGIQKALESGAVPGLISNVCPQGTKVYILEVGWLECDEAFVIRGGNASLKSTEGKSFVNKRRELPMFCVLIDHPHEGVILYETGSGVEYPEVWGPQISDIFARVRYEPKHELKNAIEATGHKLEDVKKMYESGSKILDQGPNREVASSGICTWIMLEVWTSFSTGRILRSGCMTRSCVQHSGLSRPVQILVFTLNIISKYEVRDILLALADTKRSWG
jgi:hypothetical protein